MGLKDFTKKLEGFLGFGEKEDNEPSLKNKGNALLNEIGHLKRVVNGDYKEILDNFKNKYHYSLRDVPEYQDNKFVVGIALEKSLFDLSYVGSNLIQDTGAMQQLLKNVQEKDGLDIKPFNLDVGGTSVVVKTVDTRHMECINKLLENKDYLVEFNKMYPERNERAPNENIVTTEFLLKNPDVYKKMHEAVDNTMAENLRMINQNSNSVRNII